MQPCLGFNSVWQNVYLCKWLQKVNILIVKIAMGLTFPGVEHLQEKIIAKAFQSQFFQLLSLEIIRT